MIHQLLINLFGRKIPLAFVEEFQQFVIGKAIPDITIFLDIPIKEVIRRKSMIKKTDLDRIESSNIDFYEESVKDICFYPRGKNE